MPVPFEYVEEESERSNSSSEYRDVVHEERPSAAQYQVGETATGGSSTASSIA